MRLADGRIVPDLHLDAGQVARCRALADRITAPVLELVRRHTTVSIERTVLRLFGFHGAGPGGVPWVNLMVDGLHARGLAGPRRGLLARLRRCGSGARPGAHRRAASRRCRASPRPAVAGGGRRRSGRSCAARRAAAVDELRRRVERARRAQARARRSGRGPHKYVIVATGNIYDDVEQARAAAQAGADVIAVIRSTAQSLLDYVPARRDHRGLRRDLRHPGELPHHAGGARRRVAPAAAATSS